MMGPPLPDPGRARRFRVVTCLHCGCRRKVDADDDYPHDCPACHDGAQIVSEPHTLPREGDPL